MAFDGQGGLAMKRFALRSISHILLLLVSFIFLFPFYWMIISGFKPTSELFSKTISFWPAHPTLVQYIFVFEKVRILRTLLNSIVISVGHTALAVFLCSLGGYGFAKYQFKGKKFLFNFLVATMMIPQVVGIIPSFIIMSKIGWVDTFWALIIPGAADAFGIILMRQYINSIPDELVDAARIDGASEFAIYTKVIIPLMRPALITYGLMTFIYSWNNYLWPLIILRSPQNYTILLAVNTISSAKFNTPWGAIMAGSTLAILPLVIVFLLLQKYIVSGLMVGSVKG
jgi:ABC-type glycerol-3-phosphate transport system permease component